MVAVATHSVDEQDLECLRLLWLPDCNFALRGEHVAQARGEHAEGVLWAPSRSWWGRRGSWRIETGDKHDWRQLGQQLWWV